MKLPSSTLAFGLTALLLVTLLTGQLSQRLSPDPLPPVFNPADALQTELEASGFTILSHPETRRQHLAGTHLFLDAGYTHISIFAAGYEAWTREATREDSLGIPYCHLPSLA